MKALLIQIQTTTCQFDWGKHDLVWHNRTNPKNTIGFIEQPSMQHISCTESLLKLLLAGSLFLNSRHDHYGNAWTVFLFYFTLFVNEWNLGEGKVVALSADPVVVLDLSVSQSSKWRQGLKWLSRWRLDLHWVWMWTEIWQSNLLLLYLYQVMIVRKI